MRAVWSVSSGGLGPSPDRAWSLQSTVPRQDLPQFGRHVLARQGECDVRLQEADLVAAIEALPGEAQTVERAMAADQLDQPIGKLDLAAGATAEALEMIEDLRLQDIASDDAEGRRRLLGGWLFHKPPHGGEAPIIGGDVEHAVPRGVLARHIHDSHDVAAGLLVDIDHLLEAGHVGEEEIVGEDDGEGLIADELARAPDGVAEAERLLLPRIGDLAGLGHPGMEGVELGLLAASAQRRLELEGMVEMILQRRFRATGHEDEFLDAGGPRLLEGVLDQRLVDDRQHFLRDRLGRGQEARAESADWKDSFAYRLVRQTLFPRKILGADSRPGKKDGKKRTAPGVFPGGA